MFAVGGLLSIIQAGGVLLMPPSPRFYVLRGKYAEVSADISTVRVYCFLLVRMRTFKVLRRAKSVSVHCMSACSPVCLWSPSHEPSSTENRMSLRCTVLEIFGSEHSEKTCEQCEQRASRQRRRVSVY